MLPPKTLNPEILSRMAASGAVFAYKGHYFFDPRLKNKTGEETLSCLKAGG